MVYKWYILSIGGLCATYHPLGEPETTIEKGPQKERKPVLQLPTIHFQGRSVKNFEGVGPGVSNLGTYFGGDQT